MTQTVQRFSVSLLLHKRLLHCFCVLLLGGLCQWTNATALIYALVWLYVCVHEWHAVVHIPWRNLSAISIHHSASAIYKIDDQRVCGSGQNDAADMHRGDLDRQWHGGRGHQAKSSKQQKHNDRQNKMVARTEQKRRTGRLLMLAFLSGGINLCLLIRQGIAVWHLYSCQT